MGSTQFILSYIWIHDCKYITDIKLFCVVTEVGVGVCRISETEVGIFDGCISGIEIDVGNIPDARIKVRIRIDNTPDAEKKHDVYFCRLSTSIILL